MSTATAPSAFTATLLLAKKTATGIVVPAEVVEALGAGRSPAVVATLNGYAYRSTVAVRGGEYKLPVSAEHRTAAGLQAGDTVEVTLARDTQPREVIVPDDLAAAFTPDARARFDALAPGKRKAIATAIIDAKAPETRRRRIEKAVASLSA